jgi:polysaccharide biosynthesis transport protein
MNVPSILPIETGTRRDETDAQSISILALLQKLLAFARRHVAIIAIATCCSLALGFVYLLTTPPKFTAHTRLLIDSSKLRVLQQQPQTNDAPLDAAQVDSQVELLNSDNIAVLVIRKLHLNEDPEFVGGGSSFLGRLFGASPSRLSEAESTRRALAVFLQNRVVARVGRTYALDIVYTSLNAARAAEIANAIADAYVEDQLDAKYQATRRGSSWLQDRISELRTQAINADRAVLEYKENNKIVDVVGAAGGTATRSLNEQQLSDLNTQLGTARAAAAEAQARLQRIDEVMKHDVADAVVSDSLHSEIITRLRNEYYDLSSRETVWAARYGQNHIAVVNLRTQMDTIRTSIQDELQRIARGSKSDYETAKSRVDSLEKDIAALVSKSQTTNRDRLGLRELESAAQAYHAIYDNFLQRDMEANQQESFPITEARVISPAAPPTRKSAPSGSAVLAVAAALGLAFGFAVAGIRETIDGAFRTAQQIEQELKANCLAVLPQFADTRAVPKNLFSQLRGLFRGEVNFKRAAAVGSQREKGSLEKLLDIAMDVHPYRQAARKPAMPAQSSERMLTNEHLRFVIDEPLSPFAEAFRSIKVAIDLHRFKQANQVVGITSTLPKEGKSTVSSNLAQSIAHSGKSVILVDGDLRNPTLTRSLAPTAKTGLMEVLSGQVELQQAICLDTVSNLAFLPALVKKRILYPNEILASDAFKLLVDGLRKTYDVVIIDFPPIAPVVDARAASYTVDSFIYVVEWGQTKASFVQRQLAAAPSIANRLLGVVLNKTDMKKLARYEGSYGKYRYDTYYGATIDEAVS